MESEIGNLLVKKFQDNDINFYGTHKKPLFKANDIGNLLGIKNIRDTVKDYNERQKVVVLTDTPGGQQNVTFLTVAGISKVLMKSRKPIAEKFQDWLADVVQEIYETGEYKTSRIHQKIGKSNQIIEQFHEQPIVYLGLVEETDSETQIVKYGHTKDIKKTSIRHKKSYGNQFNFIYAIESKEHYEIENKIQKHNDLQTRHVKTFDNKERQELLRLDKNFSVKNLIDLILKLKEALDKDNEIYLQELELEKIKEETKQREEETKQEELKTKQKELDVSLEMKKLELNHLFEMKKLDFSKNVSQNQETIDKVIDKNQETIDKVIDKNEGIQKDLLVKKQINNHNKQDTDLNEFVNEITVYSGNPNDKISIKDQMYPLYINYQKNKQIAKYIPVTFSKKLKNLFPEFHKRKNKNGAKYRALICHKLK